MTGSPAWLHGRPREETRSDRIVVPAASWPGMSHFLLRRYPACAAAALRRTAVCGYMDIASLPPSLEAAKPYRAGTLGRRMTLVQEQQVCETRRGLSKAQ